ncbi:hypothetical protein Ciccas_004355 [Cichlidogyrus casuarinus]|uniref:SAM domain-containing protein n=1 Tax=Cichlidogyrus casuarinus TaxID=1844966 RepID=A0ABD2QBV4_9PLAT
MNCVAGTIDTTAPMSEKEEVASAAKRKEVVIHSPATELKSPQTPMEVDHSRPTPLSISKPLIQPTEMPLPTPSTPGCRRESRPRLTSSSSTSSEDSSSIDSSQDSLPIGALSKAGAHNRRLSSLTRRASQMTEPSRIANHTSHEPSQYTASTRSSFSHDAADSMDLDPPNLLRTRNLTEQARTRANEKNLFSGHRKILTHFIDGHVIYESDKLFPPHNGMEVVEAALLNICMEEAKNKKETNGVSKKVTMRLGAEVNEDEEITTKTALPTLPMRNVNDLIESSKKARRKRRKRSNESNYTSEEERLVEPAQMENEQATEAYHGVKPIDQWTVGDVCDFIQTISGCGQYAETFKTNEIDGEALLLLSEQQFVQSMGMKIGPALKLVSRLKDVKRDTQMSML